MNSVSQRRKLLASIVEPIVSPSRMVTRLASSFCAVLDRRSSTLHSRRRLPNIRLPTSGTLMGTMMPARMVTTMGNRISDRPGRVVFGIRHVDGAFLFGRQRADDRRLDDGHQRHIAVRGHRDRRHVFLQIKMIGNVECGGAVRRADDADGGCEPKHQAVLLRAGGHGRNVGEDGGDQQHRQQERGENAELRRRAEEDHRRVFEQRGEVDHRADRDEDEDGEQLVFDARR